MLILKLIRITSYNVCYTKLLRLGDKDFIEEAFNIAPAVSRKERTLILARFILSSPSDYGIEALSAEQAINLASALGKLIDEAQSQNLSFDKLKDLVPAELSIHWQKTLNLLELITRVWPNYRITSYNVCYTKLLRHPLGGLLITYEDITDRLALETSYNTLSAVQKETVDRNNFV